MKTLLAITFALLLPLGASAESTVARELSFRWDSLRFALGILQSDYYTDLPVLVLYKTADGGVLMSYDANKPMARKLNVDQVASIVARLSVFFADAGSPPPAGAERKPPAFDMLLSIDTGFSRRSFLKTFDLQSQKNLVGEFSRYISDLSNAK